MKPKNGSGLRTVPDVRTDSIWATDAAEFGVRLSSGGHRLLVLAHKGTGLLASFEGEASAHGNGTLLEGPMSYRNAVALRGQLPWVRPRVLGLQSSVGMGDRLGIATAGHVQAVRAAGGHIAPIFAQQSIREMERTGRSPQQVMDDAMWDVFSEGWTDGFGADADHLKTTADIDLCLEAGYTFFTFDPGAYVDDAESYSPGGLRTVCAELPWEELEDDLTALKRRYLSGPFEFEGHEVVFDEQALHVAAVKYGRAVSHVARLFRHLEGAAVDPFEVEVSVDETDHPTTHAQHVYLANELGRMGIRWVSLAPRYVGDFEKGVDYIGDVGVFEEDFAVHAAIARRFGPYKLSLHSGSDKFSIYPAAVRQTRGLVHLKTAGTSYLEALRTLSALDPMLFREIYAFSRKRYEEDRISYHVSANLEAASQPHEIQDSELPTLLEQFDAREILHVTFGSVLRPRTAEGQTLRERFVKLLKAHPESYAENLKSHFLRHLKPFASTSVGDAPND